jgi:hypothetical protein
VGCRFREKVCVFQVKSHLYSLLIIRHVQAGSTVVVEDDNQEHVGRLISTQIVGRIEPDRCFFCAPLRKAAKSTRPSDEGLFTTKEIYFLSSQEGLVTRLKGAQKDAYIPPRDVDVIVCRVNCNAAIQTIEVSSTATSYPVHKK